MIYVYMYIHWMPKLPTVPLVSEIQKREKRRESERAGQDRENGIKIEGSSEFSDGSMVARGSHGQSVVAAETGRSAMAARAVKGGRWWLRWLTMCS